MQEKYKILEVNNRRIANHSNFQFIWNCKHVTLYVLRSCSDITSMQTNDISALSPRQIANEYLSHQSFLHYNSLNNKLTIVRDWPGYDQIFYLKDEQRFVISNDIHALIGDSPVLSTRGANQFLNDRKHYHNNTIFKKIKELHPGHQIILDINLNKIDLEQWFLPIRNMQKISENEAKKKYLESVIRPIKKNIPNLYSFVAIMFSGGSDSLFLLQTMEALGYKNIYLYACCVKGQNEQIDYANRSAAYLNKSVKPVYISPDQAVDAWLEYVPCVYHCLSETRLDGMPICLKSVYCQIDKDAGNKTPFVVWGSQYSVISPTTSTAGVLYCQALLVFFKLIKILPGTKSLHKKFLSLGLKRYPVFSSTISDHDVLEVYLDGAVEAFSMAKSVDAVINYILLSNYNSLKRWWMSHRDIIALVVNERIRNIYPFHDRVHQENIMNIPLSVRVGGLKNIFKLPKSYKTFFYGLIDKNIPKTVYSRGNYQTLDEFFVLFKNKRAYSFLHHFFYLNKDLISDIFGKHINFHLSYNDYLKLSSPEVERYFGVVYVCIKSNRYRFSSDRLK